MLKLSRAMRILAVGAAMGGGAVAEPGGTTSAALERQLAAHDPRAVSAARHYYEGPAIKTGLIAVINSVNKSMIAIVSKQNPTLAPQQLADLQQIVNEALNERLDLMIRMNMIAALDTLTTDELVALDRFYSSPEGVSILGKLPKIAAQLPSMMQTMMPDYMNEIRAKMKARGTELKL